MDTNIFGIDVGRNLQNANKETLLLLYQPNLMFPQPYYNVFDTEARKYLQVYNEYLQAVSNSRNIRICHTIVDELVST